MCGKKEYIIQFKKLIQIKYNNNFEIKIQEYVLKYIIYWKGLNVPLPLITFHFIA